MRMRTKKSSRSIAFTNLLAHVWKTPLYHMCFFFSHGHRWCSELRPSVLFCTSEFLYSPFALSYVYTRHTYIRFTGGGRSVRREQKVFGAVAVAVARRRRNCLALRRALWEGTRRIHVKRTRERERVCVFEMKRRTIHERIVVFLFAVAISSFWTTLPVHIFSEFPVLIFSSCIPFRMAYFVYPHR